MVIGKFSREKIWRALIVTVTVVFSSVLTPQIQASEGIIHSAPAGHSAVIAVEVDLLRSSPFFNAAITWVMANPLFRAQLRELEDRLELDLREDISSFALLSDLPPLSPELVGDPLSLLKGGADGLGDERGLFLIRGKFKAEDVVERLSEGKRELKLDDRRVLYAVDGSTLAIVGGDPNYHDQARSLLAAKAGPGDQIIGAVKKLGPPQAIYMMMAPTMEGSGKTPAKFAAIGARLGAEIDVAMLLTMADAGQAEASAQEFEGLRSVARGNPLVAAFGVQPLLERLAIRQDGPDIQLQTSASNAEAQAILLNIMRVATTAKDLGTPLGGSGFGGSEGGEPTSPDSPTEVPHEGVEADFN